MSESQLQIVISVINDAAAQLSEVGTQLASLADQTASDASTMSESMTAAAGSMETSLTAAEEAAAEAAMATLNQWNDASSGIETAATTAADTASSTFADISDSALAAANAASTGWQESLATLQTDMAKTSEQIDAEFGTMADASANSEKNIESSISSVGGKMQAVGIQLSLLGAAIAAPAAEAVKAAGDQEDAFDQLGNTVKNVYASATAPTAGMTTEIADLTAKINAQRSSIAEADAAMTKWEGTTVEVAAAHEKAATSVTTAQINIQKLQQQLDQLTQVEQLAGGSASDTAAQFEAAARANTALGFTVDDSAQALQFLFASTNSVTETMSAYQDAMDLSAAKGIDLQSAANDVIQAMNGQGRALRDLGVNVADGLAGQTALAAIQQKVAGAAEEAATHGLGPYNVATATLNKTMADFGITVLPILTQFLEEMDKVISEVDAWAQAHPKLAEALLVFLGLVGGLLLVVGPLITMFGLMVIGIEAFTTALAVMEVTLFAAIGMTLLYVAAFLAIAAIVALVIVYHKQIEDAIKAAWDAIVGFVRDHWQAILNILLPGMGTLVAFLVDHWATIKSDVETAWTGIETFISGIWTKIVADATVAVTTIQNLISKIMAPINAVTGAVQSITGGSLGTALLSTAVHAFAAGGIVTGPTLALVGEAGPEAIIPLSAFNGGTSLAGGGGVGTGGNIVVNINGGNYLDSNGANMIAQALARKIGVQLRMKNYA